MVKVWAFDVPPPGAGLVTVTCAEPAFAMSAAVIAPLTVVPFTKVVVRGEPFQSTCDVDTKPVPLTVRVNAAPPCVALEGWSLVNDGTGLLMLKVKALEVPPPGAVFTTVTFAVPAVLMSLAGTVAVSLMLLTNVVANFAPFHSTEDVETKFDPLTVSVKVAPPAKALVGESVVAFGTGLLTVKVAGAEVPPPGAGLLTVTLTVPAVAMSEAGTEALSLVPLTNVVVSATPFHCTTDVFT